MRLAVIATIVLVGVLGSANAGPLEDGEEAFQQRNFAKAIAIWTPLAEEGIGAAQSKLGQMYKNGFGVDQDFEAAARWYRLAAIQNYAEGQYNLGRLYEDGNGVPQDFSEAERWFRLSANNGNAAAQFSLGFMYWIPVISGNVLPEDYLLAFMWFELASEHAEGVESELAAGMRDSVAEDMAPGQINEARALAQKWQRNENER